MKITLPSLESTLYQKTGSKNIIKQLLASKRSIPLNVLQENRFYLLVEDNGNKICLTTKEEYIPEEIEYALFTNMLPSKKRFKEGKIVIKGWAKHPLLKEYSSNEIIQSWKNDFLYKEEDKSESGLRQPQIAALHMIMGHLKLPLDAATVVMPTGTGKTETMLSTLIANRCEKLLVTMPSDSLRNQIAEKFFNLGLLKQFGIGGEKSLYR